MLFIPRLAAAWCWVSVLDLHFGVLGQLPSKAFSYLALLTYFPPPSYLDAVRALAVLRFILA